MRALSISLVSLGAIILLFSIFKYCTALITLKKRMNAEKLFSEWIYAVCLLMMVFFLAGYVVSITGFASGDIPTMQELLIACIFFFGSIFVIAMITMMQRMFSTLIENSDLAVAREAAEQSNKAKSAFLSTMSHEIRTPMNAILGITEILLQDDSHSPDTKDSLVKIHSSGDLLLGIINDILDLSKIEAGKLELLIEKYEVASLVSDTAQLNMMRIGSKQIEFELNVDKDMPACLSGDELRVKQILNNILSNAFKYTSKGTVRLSVSAEAAGIDADTDKLIISVSDTGQGMTKEQVDMLFDEYSRFNTEANRSTEGTGLGMSITRNLIQLMGGQIFVESEPGKGSTFTVHLPQGRIDSEILGQERADNLHNFRTSSRAHMKRVQISRELMPYGSVLIVDDVETNIFVAKGLLTPYELKIESAESGFEAIEKIKNGKVYDIIFMDHMMPQMDGIEATKKIRELGYNDTIVALTANAVSGQAEIFLGNGFDNFISKPIDVRQLNTILNKYIRDKQPPEVLESVKQEAQKEPASRSKGDDRGCQPEINPEFAEVFLRDANRAIAVLEEINNRADYGKEEDLRNYIINVHGMKSALANMGKMDLSAIALKLETAGRENKLEIISSETTAFLSLLRDFTRELIPPDEPSSSAAAEDKEYLREKLQDIKAACVEYDENTAGEILVELRKAAWSSQTKDFLAAISEHLLHSDFDEIAEKIDDYIS